LSRAWRCAAWCSASRQCSRSAAAAALQLAFYCCTSSVTASDGVDGKTRLISLFITRRIANNSQANIEGCVIAC